MDLTSSEDAPPSSTKAAGSSEPPAEPSASALKKAAKAREKEEKKAAKRREIEEKQQQEQQTAAANDFAKDNYGELPAIHGLQAADIISMRQLTANAKVTIHARVQNIRSQTAKLCFLLLRDGFATVQAVVAAGDESTFVSRQMVKWVSSLSAESIVQVSGLVQKPKEPVNSASISGLEIHAQKLYVLAGCVSQVPMQLESALLPELKDGEEEDAVDSKTSKTPKVSLKTRLDNRVIDLRTPTNLAITRIKAGVSELFQEYLRKDGFVQIFSPKLIPAASEGGSNVFAVTYFERVAYLAQSPQLYKQMAIGGDLEKVYEIGPVFRAENSNTHRHLTEARSSHTPPMLESTDRPPVRRARLGDDVQSALPRGPRSPRGAIRLHLQPAQDALCSRD